MTDQKESKFEILPTGKVNISFSELSVWVDCSWRHKLQHIDKVGTQEHSVYLDYGTSVHAAHENFIRTASMDSSIATDMLRNLWKEHSHDPKELDSWINQAEKSLNDVPSFYGKTFPNWEPVAAEFPLFEKIDDEPHAFKGFIDAIITVPNKAGKKITWILDLKSTSWGWDRFKKSDKKLASQLVYYKNFWTKKTNTDPKAVKCGFVLLKRTAKPGDSCELVSVSAGDKSTKRSLNVIQDMLFAVNSGMALKNKNSCTYCEFKDTAYCP